MSKAKSTLGHKRAGTLRKDRHGDRPQVAPGAPDPPAYLSAAALAEWHRIVSQLVADVGLCPLDRGMLALYCQSWADVEKLTEEIADEGHTIETENGTAKRNPKCISLREAKADVLKTASKLGLSPIDRVHPLPPSPDAQPGIDAEMKDLLDHMS